jgi:hypothetical protein
MEDCLVQWVTITDDNVDDVRVCPLMSTRKHTCYCIEGVPSFSLDSKKFAGEACRWWVEKNAVNGAGTYQSEGSANCAMMWAGTRELPPTKPSTGR